MPRRDRRMTRNVLTVRIRELECSHVMFEKDGYWSEIGILGRVSLPVMLL